MLAFIIRRFSAMLLVLFCVVTLTFLLARQMPGGPFTRERKLSPQIEEQLKKRFNLDDTIWHQYGVYLGVLPRADSAPEEPGGPPREKHYSGLLQGDLQISTKYNPRTVAYLIGQSLPTSALLGGAALALSTFLGVWLGCLAAVRHQTAVDTGSMLGALVLISVPPFVVGPVLVLIFAIRLRWLPVGGLGSPQSLVLPVITLAGPYIAYVARLMRSSLLEVIGQDFLRTAYAKGLTERRAIYRHALKVAILPVVSFLGPLAANLLTGSIVVEMIFNIPGMGGFFVNSILNYDVFLLGGVVIVYCALLVGMNLLVDLAYSALDPRIRLYD